MQNGESVLLHGADVKSLLEEPLQVKKKLQPGGKIISPMFWLILCLCALLRCAVLCSAIDLCSCAGGGGCATVIYEFFALLMCVHMLNLSKLN